MEIGKTSYNNFDNNKRKLNLANANWGLKEGSNIYRILPPIGSLASQGVWSKYEVLHWGYVLSNNKQRVFRCIRKFDPKRKVVIADCPQCTKISEQLGLEETQRTKLLNAGKSKEEIKTLLQHFTDWKKKFNTDKKHYLNVLRPDGQIGKLKLTNNAMKALRLEIKRLRDSGEESDPVGIENGVWFDFFRVGMDKDSDYKVNAVYENVEIQGRKMRSLKPAPLSNETIERFKNEGFDLGEGYRDLSRDEIQILVESNGDPETVDSIFGLPQVNNSGKPKEMALEMEEEEYFPEEEDVTTKGSSLEDQESSLLAQLSALKAKKVPTLSVTKTEPSAEEFLRVYKTSK